MLGATPIHYEFSSQTRNAITKVADNVAAHFDDFRKMLAEAAGKRLWIIPKVSES
jgi:hypothetical protein